MKYLISCLEPSANLHFKEVLVHLKRLDPACEICGIFDEKLGSPIYKSSEFSAMGFIEILPLILKAKRAIAQMMRLAAECDRVLLIDSPAFNLPLARAIKESGARAEISYYILPQVWAWKPRRAEKLKAFCDNLLSIWPFEAKFFGTDCKGDKGAVPQEAESKDSALQETKDKDAAPKEDAAHPSKQSAKTTKYSFVGHPLLDEITLRKQSYEKQGKIAFMPGSRRAEISRLMPIFRALAPKFENSKRALIIPPHLMDQRDEIYGPLDGFSIANNTPATLKDCDFAFICSGTATLEAALIGTPFVLCYKARAFDVWLARKLVKLKHVGLANIIFDFLGEEPLHEELLQSEVSAQNLLAAYERCDAAKFKLASEKLRDYLKFGSSENVAKILTQPAS
ncbi:lipid-A-disaccharide synthase [uncultured Campylobacter sp.]|uniref:lipid-A-disaccharide synthase n=1 Tax=uncultured Campylobacter sp. TaxID=218934 RepID=UPI0026294DD5|nr:lipid-A-disaccharide synthase [uncultured Campylobacter sp.]